MVDPTSIFVWTWDARPFPAFPGLEAIWADGRNWDTGHWINGRLEGVPLDHLIAVLLVRNEALAGIFKVSALSAANFRCELIVHVGRILMTLIAPK